MTHHAAQAPPSHAHTTHATPTGLCSATWQHILEAETPPATEDFVPTLGVARSAEVMSGGTASEVRASADVAAPRSAITLPVNLWFAGTDPPTSTPHTHTHTPIDSQNGPLPCKNQRSVPMLAVQIADRAPVAGGSLGRGVSPRAPASLGSARPGHNAVAPFHDATSFPTLVAI